MNDRMFGTATASRIAATATATIISTKVKPRSIEVFKTRDRVFLSAISVIRKRVIIMKRNLYAVPAV
jgi:hypothetical protein